MTTTQLDKLENVTDKVGSMKIISLRAENVKRLKAVEITPDGNTVIIAGRNAQGKSSVLDSIWMALVGGAGMKGVSKPIRDGETKASVILDMGDLVVTRKWTQAGTTLEVAAKDGAKYSSPQTVLDSMLGRLSFDPLAFAHQDPKGQLATLLSVVDLPFDLAILDSEREAIFDKRTDANRDVKRLEAQLNGLALYSKDTPDVEVSAADLVAELQDANDAARKMADLDRQYGSALSNESRLAGELLTATALVADLLEQGKQALPFADPAPIQAQLSAINDTNAAVRAKQEAKRLEGDHTKAEKLSRTLTAKLEALDKSKADAITEAKMPLDGLSFDADGVIYNGVPFGQSSSAERLRVGIAMAMALNPKIRVIRITDGSLLDSENLALIEEMAAEHDFQIWLEVVDETGTVGITIEDGQVYTKGSV